MSWLARSLANSLRLDDDDGHGGGEYDDYENDVEPGCSHGLPTPSPKNHQRHHQQQQQPHQTEDDEFESDNEAQVRGVKEDLDEFKQTLTRQFWGMASFLAPPSTNSHPSSKQTFSDPAATLAGNQSEPSDQCASGNGEAVDAHDDVEISWIGREEIKGRFRNEVPGVSFTAPDLSSHGSEYVESGEFEMDESDLNEAVGVTEEVLTFARNIAMHLETWLDFPIDEEEDPDDFDMSDAQQEHAFVIERLAPRFAALRIELCPCHMSEGYFWKVYFVLLHSRLNKQDAEVLSTPQVMEARAMWMQELQKQTKPESEWYGRNTSYVRDIAPDEDLPPSVSDHAMSRRTCGYEPTPSPTVVDYESEKHAIESSEIVFIDKSVIEEKTVVKIDDKGLRSDRSSKIAIPNYEDDEDEWPEEDSELEGTTIPMVNEEDISFSDLEDDDYGIKPVKPVKPKTDPNTG